MSFYSYIFKPSDFIKGYCFNISWMDECTHWWNTGKNEAHTAWNDHSLSFPNMFSNSVFYMQSKKTACCFLSLLAQCFLFICEREDGAPQMTREWLWRLPAWGGKNEMLQSVNARSGESWRRDKNVSIYANCCPDPPPGCHCFLSGEKIKGPSVLDLSRIRLYSVARRSSPFGSAAIPLWCWEGSLPAGVHSRQEADSVSLRWAWRCQIAHSQLVLQSRGEGHVEFRARAMTDGCEGNLLSAAAPVQASLAVNGPEPRAGTEDGQDRRSWSCFARNISLKMFGAMLLTHTS